MDYSLPLRLLQDFALFYPLFMSYLWMVGGLAYYFHWERDTRGSVDQPPELPEYPGVSIIVPAHNEQSSIEKTVRSLLSVDYPRELFRVIVIADNCTDLTSRVAREAGGEVRERVDPDRRGKGHALRWCLDQLIAEGYDPAYGARPLKRVLQQRLIDPLALRLIQGDVRDGDLVQVDAGDEALNFTLI